MDGLPVKRTVPETVDVATDVAPAVRPASVVVPRTLSEGPYASSPSRSSKKRTSNVAATLPSPWFRTFAETEPERASVWPSTVAADTSTPVTVKSGAPLFPVPRSARDESNALFSSSDTLTVPTRPPKSSATTQIEDEVTVSSGRRNSTSSKAPGGR
jgi:hypothetical protein